MSPDRMDHTEDTDTAPFDIARERLKAIINQAIAEWQSRHAGTMLESIHIVMYGSIAEQDARAYYEEIRLGTPAESTQLVLIRGAQRYICWNCCGLRYEAEDEMCPNCGELGYEVPDEVVFGLRKIVTH